MDLSQNITYERTRNEIPNEDSYLAAAGSGTMLVQRREEKSFKETFQQKIKRLLNKSTRKQRTACALCKRRTGEEAKTKCVLDILQQTVPPR